MKKIIFIISVLLLLLSGCERGYKYNPSGPVFKVVEIKEESKDSCIYTVKECFRDGYEDHLIYIKDKKNNYFIDDTVYLRPVPWYFFEKIE